MFKSSELSANNPTLASNDENTTNSKPLETATHQAIDPPKATESSSQISLSDVNTQKLIIEQRNQLMKRKDEVIAIFSDQFDLFQTTEITSEEAIGLLMSLEPEEPELRLSSLLTEYHFGTPLFSPLTLGMPGRFTELFIYLIELNQNILYLPMEKDKIFQETFLDLIFSEEETVFYQALIEWLKTNKPKIVTDYQNEKAIVKIEQEDLIKIVKKHRHQQICTFFRLRAPQQIYKLLMMEDNELLDYLLDPKNTAKPNHPLQFLIENDLNILMLKYDETDDSDEDNDDDDLLSYLCRNKNLYQDLLILIKNKYASQLDSIHLHRLRSAIDEHIKAQKPVETPTTSPSNTGPDETTAPSSVFASPHRLIETSTLHTYFQPDSPWGIHNQLLTPYINIKDMTESIVLDAFIHRKLFEPLMQQGILVMPTIQDSESISLEQLQNIKSGTNLNILFNTNIQFLHEQVEATIEEKLCTRPRFIIWPINKPLHFGLLIIDLTNPDPTLSSRAYYIEPLREYHRLLPIAQHLQAMLTDLPDLDSVMQYLKDDPNGQRFLRPYFYRSYIERLNADLNIDPLAFNYIHLGQDVSVNYCADFVLSILMMINRGAIHLDNPASLSELHDKYLTTSDVQAIRLQQIQLFGPEYFWIQLEPSLKNDRTRQFIRQLLSPSAPLTCPRSISPLSLKRKSDPNEDKDHIMPGLSKHNIFRRARLMTVIPKSELSLREKQNTTPLRRSPLGLFVQNATPSNELVEKSYLFLPLQPFKGEMEPSDYSLNNDNDIFINNDKLDI